jgi:branched-chain amino acid transport system ATP-binding protein
MIMKVLEISNLVSGYGDISILHEISLTVDEGQIVTIVGPNGAGKTTLLRSISGLNSPSSGSIKFYGEPIHGLPPHHVVAKGIVQVLEGRQLFNFLTVEQNLMIGSSIKEARLFRKKNLELVYDLFPRLAERTNQLARTLSGGEQQMVATARGLMTNPRLLMLDEPSWGLAPMLTHELFEVIDRINKETKVTVLLVEQNVQKSLSMADNAYVIERGNLVMQGPGPEILKNERLKEAYLGL